MPTRLPVLLWLVLLSAGCAGTPGTATAAVPRPATPVRQALPAGSVLRLLPAEYTTAGRAPLAAIDGWLREALRQSAQFDVAAGAEDVATLPDTPVWSVTVACDPVAQTLVTALRVPERAAVPLASVSFAASPLPTAIDQLGLATRLALGDPCAAPTLPVALAYSAEVHAVQRTETGLARQQEGRLREALDELLGARRLDGGNPLVLDAMAGLRAVLGQTAEARSLAEEGLMFRERLTPTTQHRLARSLQLARAALSPAVAADRDAELLALGGAALRERPYDVQGRLSTALALSFLDRFEESAPLWRALVQRLPNSAIAQYHLGWAELATGRPAAAAEILVRAADRLPRGTTMIPLAIARYEQGDQEGLRRYFAELQADPELSEGIPGYHLRRMQAAQAILINQTEVAVRLMLDSLEWLRARPSMLATRAGELAEVGEVLVRLGQGEAVGLRITALQELRLSDATLSDALAYVQGLVQVARTGQRATTAEAALSPDGRIDAFGLSLQAFGHRAAGHLLEEYNTLAQAARINDSPLIKAALVRSLRAMGRNTDADQLRDALQREMRAVHLRRRLRHPLLAPDLALAFRIE